MYCLLVLRTIRRADEVAFVPHLSVTLGVLLALVSLGVLIYFIHHVAVSIQADEVIARVGSGAVRGIERLFPATSASRPERARPRRTLPAHCRDPATTRVAPVAAARDGYLQLDRCRRADGAGRRGATFCMRLERRPGHYVVKGRPLVIGLARRRVDEELRAA